MLCPVPFLFYNDKCIAKIAHFYVLCLFLSVNFRFYLGYMNFRTQVELPEKEAEIGYSHRLMLLGSCFTENIGKLLEENKFSCDVNPFGVLYNPLSIAKALYRLMEGGNYLESDLFTVGGLWHSWMHHSSFSALEVQTCLDGINTRLNHSSSFLKGCDWLVVTWGTAYVYRRKDTGEVVGNCHKQPDKLFTREKLGIDEIVLGWKELLDNLKVVNPRLKVMLTVSPIRHAKDGMHGNQLSKSTLLLAADELCKQYANCTYFPSYEIMMDELRDYRFYADDMLHPSKLAIEYIWECFEKTYFSDATMKTMREWQDIRKGLAHKPFNPESEAYRKFLSQIVLKIDQLKEKFPNFDVQKELEQCKTRLKTL